MGVDGDSRDGNAMQKHCSREGTSWFLFYPRAKRESLDDSPDGKESA